MAIDTETAPAVKTLAADALPVGSLREAAPHLRRPFTPEAIKFKVQSVFKEATGCVVVAYIDARLVVERLNAVLPDLWSETHEVVGKDGLLLCRLTVDGVTHEDVGQSPKGLSKDLYSDALKRAAVKFGVGVSVYALPEIVLWTKDARGRIEVRTGPKGKTIVLTEKGHAKLRDGYRGWLESFGEKHFGPPLDHGDAEGQTVDPEVESPDEFVPAPPPPLKDERAETLKAQARDVYKAICETPDGRKWIPPGTFNGWLAGAAHDHDELERLVAHLLKRYDELAGREEAE